MTEYRKTNLTLPDSVREYISTLEPGERGSYMSALRHAHWTLESIARCANITRERVRQLVATFEATPDAESVRQAHVDAGRVPFPPVKPERPKPVYVEPDPEALARMLELQEDARKVRSNSPNYRAEAEEYTRLIAEQHQDGEGVTLYRLAKRLGVTHLALRARLVRYGYKTPQKGGSSRVYTPITAENRPAQP